MERRTFLRLALGCALAAATAPALSGCASDADQAREAVEELMESYVVPVADEDGNEPEDAAWSAADFGDAATMEVLQTYGVDANEWRRHCLSNLSFEVGDASAEDGSATVSVTVTNASLSAAVEAAGADFAAFTQGEEAQETYRQGGKPALFSQLVSYVYAHLDANESPVTSTVSVRCEKGDDGAWVPQVAGDEAFFSALYGGSDVVAGLAAASDEPAV